VLSRGVLRISSGRRWWIQYDDPMDDGGAQGTVAPLTVSVVICTYDRTRFESLTDAVHRIRAQVRCPTEIVVVVNGNEALAREVNSTFAGVTVVESAHVGVSVARELGVQTASGDIVAFIDDDALPAPSWLANLIEPFAAANVMMTSGHIDPLWITERPSWFPDEFLWVVGCSYRGLPGNGGVLRNPIGASMAIRRSVIEAVGTFESRLGRVSTDGNGCEETEYAIRAHHALPDGVVVLAGDSTVQHLVPRARTTFSYFVKRCWREGRSKAILVEIAGRRESLSAERAYVRSVLPRGVLRNLKTPSTWAQAAAIVAGVGTTALGFIVFRIWLDLQKLLNR